MDFDLESIIYCPTCGSKNIRSIVKKEDYDLASGILGTICLGPIGLLCGFLCNDDKKKVSCICNDCGTRFNK